jgi:hypothetical protein
MKEEGMESAAGGKSLGMVVGGSFEGGVEVKLHPGTSVEEIKAGTFVTIQGEKLRFLGLVTDVALAAADPRLHLTPPDVSDPFIAQVVSGTTAYGTLKVRPQLVLPEVLGDAAGPQPARTVPAHFSQVYAASERDVEMVFGREDERHFYIGNPLDMETKLCLDLEEFVKRSNGIFGKAGTGKTFLTRLLLIGILQKDTASSLVFDMHSEYGWQGYREGGGYVKGLKQLFPSKVGIFTLDEESARRRRLSPDFVIRVGYDEIEPEDVELLRETLNLSEVAAQGAYMLERNYGKGWLREFLELEGREAIFSLAKQLILNEAALSALHRRLQHLRRFHFLVPEAGNDSVQRILDYLGRGNHIVLEFGRYGNDLSAYILVANLLTRRIHQRYVQWKEEAMGTGAREPRPLVITIEEAHKFLNPAVASQTIFGIIAREMRKYNVTLLVIDQRPSAIDSEVMSQLGTKITCLLDNERDIDAVLAGVPGGRELRTVLSRLESKQQALVFGHSVPIPVVVRTREYGTERSYAELARPPRPGEAEREKELEELFGER